MQKNSHYTNMDNLDLLRESLQVLLQEAKNIARTTPNVILRRRTNTLINWMTEATRLIEVIEISEMTDTELELDEDTDLEVITIRLLDQARNRHMKARAQRTRYRRLYGLIHNIKLLRAAEAIYIDLTGDDNVEVESPIVCLPDPVQVCAICYELTYFDEVSTSCRHVFHKTCLDLWMMRRRSCPMCRTGL